MAFVNWQEELPYTRRDAVNVFWAIYSLKNNYFDENNIYFNVHTYFYMEI